ncbi:hypothetical protein [Streptomyces lunalinharesii]|uniref:Uncharacterized protein n=1 Tax=Streptomyces lunalinharesii TaxID=333384 RepID=A0ABN3SR12_9ACTN
MTDPPSDAVAPAGFAELYVRVYLNAGSSEAAAEEVADGSPARTMTTAHDRLATHASSLIRPQGIDRLGWRGD